MPRRLAAIFAADVEGFARLTDADVSSASGHDHVRKRLPLTFADLGPQQVKNIDEPVRAYAVDTKTEASSPARLSSSLPDVNKPLSLPDKPSIAVLRFQNMSRD